MKKNVLVFGLLAGALITAMMIYSTTHCYKSQDFDDSIVLGYTSMLIAFAFIFVGIKNVRDKYNGGVISFGKAFLTGLYITLIASSMYVVVWLVEYYFFMPDFMEKYSASVLKGVQTSGASAVEIAKEKENIASMTELYKNPLFVILFTYFEVVPIGLVVSLISALILKRKKTANKVEAANFLKD